MDQDRLRFNEAEFSYVENTIDFPLFKEVVDELAKDFFTVQVSRRSAGPMATPLFGDVAIVFAVGAASGAFLAELGKDVYRGLRAGLFTLYKAAKTWANRRGYVPFAIRQEGEEAPWAGLHFTFPEGMEREEFEEAILSIPDAVASLSGDRTGPVGFIYKDGHWKSRRG